MPYVSGTAQSHGPITVDPFTCPTSASGRITTAALDKMAVGAKQGVTVQADPANTGTVYVNGPGTTTTNGIALAAKDSMVYPVRDPYSIFAIASTSGQILRISYI